MRKLSAIFLWAVLLSACHQPLFDPVPLSLRNSRPRARLPVLADTTSAEPRGPDIYATALRFPDWVAWREGDRRSPEVLLFKNGRQIMTVPASASAQRHRYRAGHLWTDISDGAQTILYRDGEEYFRFAGDELFQGFEVVDGQVHTLGQRQGGEGFCYRTEGEEVFSSLGTLLGSPSDREWKGGAFSEDLHYSYGLPVWKGTEIQWEYHVMQGAEQVTIIPASETERVFDIRFFRGSLYRSELRSGGNLCLVNGPSFQQLTSGNGQHLCKLVPYGDEICVRGFFFNNNRYTYWLRNKDRSLFSATSPDRFFGLLADGDLAMFITLDQGGHVRGIWNQQITYGMKNATFDLVTAQCCDFRNGIFAAALSSVQGDRHILMTNARRDTVSFNGFFTSIQIL